MPLWNVDEIINNLNTLVDNYNNGKYDDKNRITDGIGMSVLMLETLDSNYLPKDFYQEALINARDLLSKESTVDIDEINNNNYYNLDISNDNLIFLEKIYNIETDNIDRYKIVDNIKTEEFIVIVKDFFKGLDEELYNLLCRQK